MAVGDTTASSIIWVPGETQGHDITGTNLVAAPTTVSGLGGQDAAAVAAAKAYTDILHTRLVASGYLPV